ncbi:hypothetical protein GQ55_4G247200 [Panicum hallii var. hallii]|uniref:DUF1618 domain-containing protein n=1 Tax=Panicum hallii var. hallii TaxID=1504633 RepID=A0A2T7DZX8_9POAL|nr:hypothetical protein GQ55_4G247200 [Panicum hallii var. hallii]
MEEEEQQQPPRPWVILGRIPRVVPGGGGGGDEDAELEADAERAADFSFPVVLPPRVTVMNAFPTAHPDPNNPDKYPYILGVSSDYILLNFGVRPFCGVCFDNRPFQSNLIVVRHFDASGVEQGRPSTGAAERIQLRDGKFAVTSNLESIGILATPNGVQHYIIAELMVDKGCHTVMLVYIFSDSDKWYQEVIPNPLPDVNREWVPSGVVAHGEMLWWFDLSWGIISFDPDDGLDVPLLLFHPLPEDSALEMTVPGIHDHRCITESGGELLYVEIIPEGEFGPTVCLWTRTSAGGGNNATIGWDVEHLVTFEEIWNDDTYEETGLPRKVPVLAAVSPSNSDLVYFVLEERLFGVDLLTCTVSEFVDEDYDLVTPWPALPSCRYVLPWYLPQALAMDPGDLDSADAEQLAEDVQDGLVIDVEEMQEDEIHEEEQMAVDIDDILKEDFLDHGVEQVLAEVHAANAQAQAQQPSTDDEELEEEELDDEEQQPEEIDEEEQQPEEIDLEEQPTQESHTDEPSSEEMLEMDLDPGTVSRLRADVTEHFSDKEKYHPGPSQDPGDDAGEGAF